MTDETSRLLSIAQDPQAELRARVQALESVARTATPELVPSLLELWKRPRPHVQEKPVNWDPDAAERVVDLHIILVLSKAGDLSLVHEIAPRVARAGRVLQGPDDELRNAAKVIRTIGRPEPVQDLIALAAGKDPVPTSNAVRTLQMLQLPAPATGGPVPAFPELTAPVAFTIHRWREELETLERVSQRRIQLSPGTRALTESADYDRGEVRRSDTTLTEILTQELDLLGLTYSTTPSHVVICTFREGADLWQRWHRGRTGGR